MEQLRIVRWGLVPALLAILLGFCLGGAFGAFEHPIQDWLKSLGEPGLATVYANDAQKLEQTVERAWHYFLRAHMHGGGIGSASLGMCLLLAFLPGSAKLRAVLAAMLGFGAIGYSSYWLLAGMRAPVLGSTGAAKESLSWLAIPTAGALLIGVALTLALTVWTLWSKKAGSATPAASVTT
jgi:hypothetical protein